jgi:hypothetical protein
MFNMASSPAEIIPLRAALWINIETAWMFVGQLVSRGWTWWRSNFKGRRAGIPPIVLLTRDAAHEERGHWKGLAHECTFSLTRPAKDVL